MAKSIPIRLENIVGNVMLPYLNLLVFQCSCLTNVTGERVHFRIEKFARKLK
jgi:hypothetical protein